MKMAMMPSSSNYKFKARHVIHFVAVALLVGYCAVPLIRYFGHDQNSIIQQYERNLISSSRNVDEDDEEDDQHYRDYHNDDDGYQRDLQQQQETMVAPGVKSVQNVDSQDNSNNDKEGHDQSELGRGRRRRRTEGTEKMNVLMIVIDDLNDWVNHIKDHPRPKIPNINKLKKSSVVFKEAYSPSSACLVCCCTRVSVRATHLRLFTVALLSSPPSWSRLRFVLFCSRCREMLLW